MPQDRIHAATSPRVSESADATGAALSGEALSGEALSGEALPGEALPGEALPAPERALRLGGAAAGIVLRPERAADLPFLAALFRASALPDLALLPVDDAVRDTLARMQFRSQTATYRAEYPRARFDIVERDGAPIGRIVVDPGGAAACIVDFALLPERRGHGIGGAILAAVLEFFAHPKRPVTCMVLERNEASLRMCRRLGFVATEAIPPFLRLAW
jgi:RimJ/RimL family protein N-acetyltransferase